MAFRGVTRKNRRSDSRQILLTKRLHLSPGVVLKRIHSEATSRTSSLHAESSYNEESGEELGTGIENNEHISQKRSSQYACHHLLDNRIATWLFRVCAMINLLSLIFSAPLTDCHRHDGERRHCNNVLIQLVTITVVDFLLALLYSSHLCIWFHYCLHRCWTRYRNQLQDTTSQIGTNAEDNKAANSGHANITSTKLFLQTLITMSLWYSVGVGVYRSYNLQQSRSESIRWYVYLPFIVRSLATLTAMKMFVHLKATTQAFQQLLKNIKWKQLLFVTLFYVCFIYMHALVGVQWIGGLPTTCVMKENQSVLGIPVTHCNNHNDSRLETCFFDENMMCLDAPNGSNPHNINYRDRVYFGQYRTILDALFAVYEASSLELWYFMATVAISGSPRSVGIIAVFHISLVLFLVFLVQQSVFLVVIIESFADLRGDAALTSTHKNKDKPVIVLESTDESLRLQLLKTHESTTAFEKTLKKYYTNGIEWLFHILVLFDAIITATKHTGMSNTWAFILKCWQPIVSALFLIEIAGVMVFHIFYSPSQFRLFYRNIYYWYLLVIAVFGMIASIPVDQLYYPQTVSSALAVFQALRLPRAVQIVPSLKRFFFKILGGGLKLFVVFLIVVIFLVWFAVVSMQIFGYLDTEEACERFGSDQFGDFFSALKSMVQLVMQEGWTELMSEMMCHRDGVWWLMNIYFIVLHLFGSLVLLNFFVAVILDNLDRDDGEKKEKLERELKERKSEKISWKLKIFQSCGPKLIEVPTLSADSEGPDLAESDVKKFYNAEAHEPPTDLEQTAAPTSSYSNHRSSSLELSQTRSGTLSHEYKFSQVQGILNHVKAFRQHNRETEVTARPSINPTSKSSNDDVNYGEKYRLFDKALFCMPPEHWLRKLSNRILNAKMEAPNNVFTVDSESHWIMAVRRVARLLRSIISFFPYFTWLILIITLSTIAVQIAELDIPKINVTYVWLTDIAFIIATLAELILKILARGLFFNPKAAISSIWDLLDWIIVVATFILVIIHFVHCPVSGVSIVVAHQGLPPWMLALIVFRQIRPLRLISLIPSMRQVLYDVILGWRKFLQAAILLTGFIFMFASLGVQLFAGMDSPQRFCNDPSITTAEECTGEFTINLDISAKEIIPTSEYDVGIHVPRVWFESHRDYKFDNTLYALLTLFQVLTLEGWVDVRDIFSTNDNLVFDMYMSLYLHTFVFLGVNLGLQLFVGIVVNNFNEHKPNHSALLTVSQKRWQDLTQRISLTRPVKLPLEPRINKFRIFVYKMLINPRYKHVVTVIVILNSSLLWVPWDDRYFEIAPLMGLFMIFPLLYIVEFLLRLFAFGRQYFQSWRNTFDCLLLIPAVVFIFLAIIYLVDEPIDIQHVADTALALSVLKFFTVLMKYSTFQNLLITVGNTILKSTSLIGVLLTFILTYSFVGNVFFNNLQSGEAIDYGLVNFNGAVVAFSLVIRVATGEDWYKLLTDAMVQEPYCSTKNTNCGNPVLAIIWFISFHILVVFILINVVIAVLLENFSIFYTELDTEITHVVVKDFKQNWLRFDRNATGTIGSNRVKLFLRTLRLRDLFTCSINENGIKERRKYNTLTDSLVLREIAEELGRESRHLAGRQTSQPLNSTDHTKEMYSFQYVLKTLAYRAEDTTERLVPHELYTRNELEENVRYDVAEECILKWMQYFVKSVVKNQASRTDQNTSPIVLHKTHESITFEDNSVPWMVPIESRTGLYETAHTENEDDCRVANHSTCGHQQTTDTLNNDTSLKDQIMAKSYTKLEESVQLKHTVQGAKDKWHEWFDLQSSWMEKVQEDPDIYFDDNL